MATPCPMQNQVAAFESIPHIVCPAVIPHFEIRILAVPPLPHPWVKTPPV